MAADRGPRPTDASEEALRLRLGGMSAAKAIEQSGAELTPQALNRRASRKQSESASESSRGKRQRVVEPPESPPTPTEPPSSNPPSAAPTSSTTLQPQEGPKRQKPYNLTSYQAGKVREFNAQERGKEKAAFKEATTRCVSQFVNTRLYIPV
jgi:hypothetical protein